MLTTPWLEPGLPSSMAGGKRPRTTQWSLVLLLAHLRGGLDLQGTGFLKAAANARGMQGYAVGR